MSELHLCIPGSQEVSNMWLEHGQGVQGKLLFLVLGKGWCCPAHCWRWLAEAPLAGTDAQAPRAVALVKQGQLGRSHGV